MADASSINFNEQLIGPDVVEGDFLEFRLDVYLSRDEGLGCDWHDVIGTGYVWYLEAIVGIQKGSNLGGDRIYTRNTVVDLDGRCRHGQGHDSRCRRPAKCEITEDYGDNAEWLRVTPCALDGTEGQNSGWLPPHPRGSAGAPQGVRV